MSIQDDGKLFVTLQGQAAEFQGNRVILQIVRKSVEDHWILDFCYTLASLKTGFGVSVWGLIYNLLPRQSHFEEMLILKCLLLAYGLYIDLKLHQDCCCPLNSYYKSHLNASSYCFHCFAFILGALTNASCTINFHVFEFRLHCEIQTVLCVEPYLILAFLYKILLLCLWFTITSCFLFVVCVHARVCVLHFVQPLSLGCYI